MEKAKKVLYIGVTVLELLLLAGAYVVNHFTIKKLGVTRWMNFHGMQWEENYPVFMIKLGVILLMVLLAVLIIWLYIRRKKKLKWYAGLSVMFMCVMVLIAAGYIVFCSFAAKRAYYVICMILALAALLQEVKTLTGMAAFRKG